MIEENGERRFAAQTGASMSIEKMCSPLCTRKGTIARVGALWDKEIKKRCRAFGFLGWRVRGVCVVVLDGRGIPDGWLPVGAGLAGWLRAGRELGGGRALIGEATSRLSSTLRLDSTELIEVRPEGNSSKLVRE